MKEPQEIKKEKEHTQSGPEVASYAHSAVGALFFCYCWIKDVLITYLLFKKESKL